MIHKASFSNFRGFENLELSDLQNITLISGKNNSGKSSVLEGIFLALYYRAPDSFALLNNIRGISFNIRPDELWDTLFHNLLLTEKISINISFDDIDLNLNYTRDDRFVSSPALNEAHIALRQFVSSFPQSYSLKYDFSYGDFSENGLFVMNPQGIQRYTDQADKFQPPMPIVQHIISSRTSNNNSVVELFGYVIRKNKKDKLIDYLKFIDSSIIDIATITSGTNSQLYANIGGHWLPFRLAGDGFDHMLLIIASMIAQPNSILLVDEIETGFHYSVYSKLWDAVMLTAKQEHCQIIATTHSYECITSAAAQADANGMQDDFCYFRLGKNKLGQPAAFRFSQEILLHATDSNLEVR